MTCNSAKRNAFALVLVLAILTLIGFYMVVLAADANTILFQTNQAYLHACRQNLAASGLAWAQANMHGGDAPGQAIKLDTSAMNIRRAELAISIHPAEKGQVLVEVNTRCAAGRQNLNTTESFNIDRRL